MNSKSGHSSVIGEKAGKIVDYEVKIKSCRVCYIAVRNGAPPRQHNYRKSHDGSSKSMEQASAVASLTSLEKRESPRITSVQYCGGCSVLWRLFSTVGG